MASSNELQRRVDGQKPIPAAALHGVISMYMVLCTLFTCTRFYARIRIHRRLWWDDWTMLLAWILNQAFIIMQYMMVQNGAGANLSSLSDAEYAQFSKLFVNSQPVARFAMLFAKLSILLLYVRIFFSPGTPRSTLWWLIQVVAWINILYAVALTIVVALSAVDQYLLLIISSVINILTDVLVLIVPMRSVWSLQMGRRTKWAVWGLFAFGTLAPLSSVARLGYQVATSDATNETVVYAVVLMLVEVEQVVAMMSGSAPVASAITLHWFKGFWRWAGFRGQAIGPNGRRRPLSHRIWPGKEGHMRLDRKRSSRTPDPYPITDALEAGSRTTLRPNNSSLAPSVIEMVDSGYRSGNRDNPDNPLP